MTLSQTLTSRQRAMLDEMGIKLFWWPKTEMALDAVPSVVAEAESSHAAEARAEAGRPEPLAPPVQLAPAPAPVPAAEIRRPLAATQGVAVLADAPRRLYGDSEAASQGGWLVVADMPPGLDGRHGEPFAGDAGRLLDNMLRALQLHGGEIPVYLMRTHRGVASGQPGSPRPLGETLAGSVAALAPRIVLAMGPLAAQSLLQSTDPLGKLRGCAIALAMPTASEAIPVVATYHPAYLLRNPADKGRAWADLCLAAEELARRG
jgi:DNA polymerase